MSTAVMRSYATSVGKKMVMALSGIALFGYVLVHMLGNLQIYAGPEKLNSYANFLHSNASLLWTVRTVLVVAVVLHMVAATQLFFQARAARPRRYRMQVFQESSYAARTMIFGGPIIALFVIYHVLHLTTGDAHRGFVPGDVYGNVVAGFQVWWVSAAYILAMVALGFHLFHGVWSMLQTLGANHPKYNQWRKRGSIAFAVVIAAVNISFPVSVLTGLVE